MVEAALSRTAAQLSAWDAASSISRFNRATPLSRHALEPQFAQALACALRWAALSDGVFDPTVGPLTALWARCQRADATAPTTIRTHEVAAAQARVGWRHVKLDGATRTVVQPGGMRLDLAAVANGVAIDHVAAMLHVRQINNFSIQLAGEFRADGHGPRNDPWEACIDVGAATPVRLGLGNLSVSTATSSWMPSPGAKAQRGEPKIDPRTGEAPTHALTSVTVLHRECKHADALSTLLSILGPEDGLAFAQHRRPAAMFVCPDGAGHLAHHSDKWRKLVQPEPASQSLTGWSATERLS